MSQSALDPFSITRHAVDPRADGASRVVHLSGTRVIIERVLQGVRMRVAVPVAAYVDLAIAVHAPGGSATLTLRHEDAELNVVIGSGEAVEMAKSARAWSTLTGKPITVEKAWVSIQNAFPRRRKRACASRRCSFARRRKIGRLARMETSYAGEREIIART